jgi:polar amino acid transport system substrate-binding protein
MRSEKRSVWKTLSVFATASLIASASAWAQVDTLASIKQKGKIVVGVKADYKPFGYTDPTGKIVGFEIDMANETPWCAD